MGESTGEAAATYGIGDVAARVEVSGGQLTAGLCKAGDGGIAAAVGEVKSAIKAGSCIAGYCWKPLTRLSTRPDPPTKSGTEGVAPASRAIRLHES